MDNVRKDNNGDGNVKMSGGDEQCRVKRGRCEVHKLKGDKTETTTKKWAKFKHGYGWVTRKTVSENVFLIIVILTWVAEPVFQLGRSEISCQI